MTCCVGQLPLTLNTAGIVCFFIFEIPKLCDVLNIYQKKSVKTETLQKLNLNGKTSRRYALWLPANCRLPMVQKPFRNNPNLTIFFSLCECMHFYLFPHFSLFLGLKGFHTISETSVKQVLLDIKWTYELAWPFRNQIKPDKPIAVIYGHLWTVVDASQGASSFITTNILRWTPPKKILSLSCCSS